MVIKMIATWLSVTTLLYGLAYMLWGVSPLISVALVVIHAGWHAMYTAVPGHGTNSDDDDGASGSITHLGRSTSICSSKYYDDF